MSDANEISIDNYELESDAKRTKLLDLIKDGSIKKYCGRGIKEDKLVKMSAAEVEECYNLYLEKYNNELRKPFANTILNLYSHTVNRFQKLDSVDKLTEDLVKDPAIEALFNKIPNEFISAMSYIIGPIMMVSHTMNHIQKDKSDNFQSNDNLKTVIEEEEYELELELESAS